jgi:hypothetical protein
VGVPAGGTAGQFLTKTTTGVDYATGWTTLSLAGYATESWVTAGFYPLTGNPSGFITSSALTPYLLSSTAATTYQTLSGMSSYLSKAGNLSGLANTETARTNLGLGTMATATATDYLSKAGDLSGLANTGTARTNLGLGTISTFNDAPSDGSQYARKNGAWDVVTGGGASLPAVQIAASTINPGYIDCTPVPHCLALAYPSKTEILNGTFATGFSYTNDPDSNPSLTLTGLSSVSVANVTNNQQMTSGPNFTNCSSLVTVNVENNDAMISPPNFTGCENLTTVYIDSNNAMTTAPNFTGCTSLTSVNITSSPMATSPNFTGLNTLNILVISFTPMTQAPNLTGCASINSVNLSWNSITSSNLLAMCVQIYDSGAINGYLNIIGDNMPFYDGFDLPTQITDLQGAGWTVEFNDSNPP